jgi:hypothetical protein
MLKVVQANRRWATKIAEYFSLPQRTSKTRSILSSRRHFGDKFLQTIKKFVNLHLGTTPNQEVLRAQVFCLWLAHHCFCVTILPSWIIVAIGSVISTDVNRRTAWLCPSHFTWFPVWCYVIQRCEMQAVKLNDPLVFSHLSRCNCTYASHSSVSLHRATETLQTLKDAWTLRGSADLTCQGTSST